jgi:GH24 family phage-related lysozyme (muramidase)
VADAAEKVTAALTGQNAALAEQAQAQTRAQKNTSVLSNIKNSQYQDSGKSAEASASVFAAGPTKFEQQDAAAADAEAKALQRIRDALNPLVLVERDFATQMGVLRRALDAGTIGAEEFTAAETKLTAQAKRAAEVLAQQAAGGEKGFLGLRSYELQNLGYQVNDILTQLASGTSLMRTLGQQSGQIVQIPAIFERLAAAFKNPIFIGAALTFAGIAATLKLAADQADRLRDFRGFATVIGSGDPKQLAASAQAIHEYGVASKDATAAVKTFAENGVDPSRFVEFGKAAKDASDVLGGDFKDATAAVSKGLTGNVNDMLALNQQFHFLSPNEEQHLRQVEASGNAEKARAEAVALFTAKYGTAAAQMRGPWTDAIKNFSSAWDHLTAAFGNSEFAKDLLGTFSAVADFANRIAASLDAASTAAKKLKLEQTIGDRADQIEAAQKAGDTDKAHRLVMDNVRDLNALNEMGNPKPVPAAPVGENPDDARKSKAARDAMDTEQQLQALRMEGEQAVQNLRLRNEKFLTDKERADRIKLAGDVAAKQNLDYDAQTQQRARAIAEQQERQKIQQEQDAFNTASLTPAIQARQFIIGKEGFTPRAKIDSDGRYRVGYGSDTATAADGSVSRVTASTTSDITGAVRDLDRRIGEFQDAIKSQIGGDRFGTFSSQQQAALTSIAYNYGKLPDRILDAVRHGTNDQIADAVRGLAGDNNGANRGRRNAEAAILAQPNVAVDQNSTTQADTFRKQQDALNTSIDETNAKLALGTAELEKQAGLRGEALLKAQAQAAADKAEADLIAHVREQNAQRGPTLPPLVVTDAQRATTRQDAYAAVATPQATTRSQLEDAQHPVDSLTAEQGALRGRIAQATELGDTDTINQLAPQLDTINTRLQAAITNLQAFYAALTPAQREQLGITPDDIAAIDTGLQQAKAAADDTNVSFLGVHESVKSLKATIAGDLTDAIDGFSQAIANGAKPFTALEHAFLSFASTFLRQIAQMILQQLALNAAQAIMGGLGIGAGVGAAGAGFSASSVLLAAPLAVAHSGGVVGSGMSRSRSIGSVLAGAARFHSGGLPGLSADEVPAILQKGEEVLSKADPRNILNGGGSGAAPAPSGNLKVESYTYFDKDAMLNDYLNSAAGTKRIIGLIRDNSSAVRGALS